MKQVEVGIDYLQALEGVVEKVLMIRDTTLDMKRIDIDDVCSLIKLAEYAKKLEF